MNSIKLLMCAALAAPLSFGLVASAEEGDEKAEPKSEIKSAIEETKPLFNARLRYETIDQDGFSETANALTYRFRAGFETGEVSNTRFLLEFDHVEDLIDDFNSTINGKTMYPVVADPNVTELNRLQLTNSSLPDTKVTLGRQRIILDDARFVGNVGWRQNEQTFDGIRFENSSLGDLNLDVSYINRVNRIFGDDSPMGSWEGDTYLVNAKHPTPIGDVTGFAYVLDIDDAGGIFSSQTIGARLNGEQKLGKGKFSYVASYAQQNDYGSSPFDYSADYLLAEGTFKKHGFSAGVGYEVLSGDDQRAFQTPLATLHKFQGLTDKFLTTPIDGIEDLYVKAGYTIGDTGPFKGTKLQAGYHDFSAESGGQNYGSEFNIKATSKWKKLGFTFKYAVYDADTFSKDTDKIAVQVDFGF